MNDFRDIADAVASDITSGRLRPGERLPPQRQFAYRHRIAASTASRVYAELTRRGLISGEVGRGTYVRTALAQPAPALTEPSFAPLDLELNFPLLPEQGAALIQALQATLRLDTIHQALRPVGTAATTQARAVAAEFLGRAGWKPGAEGILFTGNGKQAIASVMAALAAPGDRIGVEALTYPVVKGIAARLGISLAPLKLDQKGIVPDALMEAHRSGPLRAIYLQPCLHNPLGITMDDARRRDIAAILKRTGLIAIEDAIYSFLADEAPLAALAPDQVILVDSLSKRIAPGMTLGFIASPAGLTERIAQSVRSGAWSAAGLPLAVGLQLMVDGTADQIAKLKREDASARQVMARAALAGLNVKGDPRAYQLWLELPRAWRVDSFVAAAFRQGIAISPGSAFTARPGHAPNAVRIALSAPPRDALLAGLQTLRHLVSDDNPDVE
ncbi:PLP-dependent aminotransferase family protein [Chelatococcus asaccharovorans]|uniref:DNA-binding transcriptional MocR family regulator n=1 Tax=Chelatococcus asaccharovorans TaxID=28210 RepID=A0A2V3U3N3_9HYPH|nr:PLP-dependent aminotransferase family protein [Chelatococcus asaccharovorans]MBS7702985.1 PLP-dependent aminotransferase family protein [Chelatococcus asaccharovorans]PXW57283.1 DNA-binding transcriptional MocR family regulator [Chelatococcus asaccharovorans]